MKKLNKQILSALLVLVMLLNSCPFSVFATDVEGDGNNVPETTQATEAPVAQIDETEPPSTETESPATESSATEAPTTESSATEAPTTESSATDPEPSGPVCNCDAAEREKHVATCPCYKCSACGAADCTSVHTSWCAACQKDDCGIEHKFCPTCGVDKCESEHANWCAACQKDDCGVTHVFCNVCNKYDCGKTHVFCDVCNKYDCGQAHIFCDICQMYDCIVDGHGKETEGPTDPTEHTDPTDPTDPSDPTDPTDPVDNCPYCEDTVDENGEPVHGADCYADYVYNGAADVGKYAKLSADALSSGVRVSANPKSDGAGAEFSGTDFEENTIMRITGWYWDSVTSAVWYRIVFYSGGVTKTWPSSAWILDRHTKPDNDDGPSLAFVPSCGICGRPACVVSHVRCEICNEYDCDAEHKICATCGADNCESEHTNWCDECRKDDCGLTHAPVDPLMNKMVAFKSTYPYLWSDPANAYSQTPVTAANFPAKMRVVESYPFSDTLTLYKLESADDSAWPEDFADYVWVEARYLEVIEEEPENTCKCCANCTGDEECQCGCGECTFCDPVIPELKDETSGVTVFAESFPEGVSLFVRDTNVSSQLSQFGVSAEKQVFGLDISLILENADYQPESGVLVKVPVNAAPGTKIGILHTHNGKTTYMGLTEVLADGTVEFYTDGFSTFAGFTVDFHYNGIDYSIDGLTSIKLSELFQILEIDRDVSNVSDVTYSDPSQIKVIQIEGDWQLESLKAFDTHELLTVTFYDGEIITIDVTDKEQGKTDYTANTTYEVPYSGNDWYTVWIEKGQLPATVTFTRNDWSTYKFWYEDSYDPVGNYISVGDTTDTKSVTVTVSENAPIGCKYGIQNADRYNNIKSGVGIIRVYKNATIRYLPGAVSSTMPKETTVRIGTWGMSDSAADTIGRTYTHTLPAQPTATGYTFDGWQFTNWQGNTQKVKTGNVNLDADSISGNYINFTAQWTPNSYTYNVVYKTQSGVTLGTDTVTNYFGGTYEVKPKAFTGYTTPAVQNITWDSTSAKTITFAYEPASNAVTYEYTGTIYPNLPNKPDTKYYSYNTSVSVEAAPTLTGYTFSGWTTSDATVSGGKFTMPDKTVIFSGHWTPNKYNLTFKYNGGRNSETEKSGDVTFVATYGWQNYYGVGGLCPERDGYNFTGWYTAANGGIPVYNSENICIPGTQYWDNENQWIGTSNATFYAQWTPIDYTAKFVTNVSGMSNPEDIQFNIEKAVTMPTLTRAGYTYQWKPTAVAGNWSTSSLYNGGASAGVGKYGNVTFTAQWTTNSYPVKFRHCATYATEELLDPTTEFIPYGEVITDFSNYAQSIPGYKFSHSEHSTYTVQAKEDQSVSLFYTENVAAIQYQAVTVGSDAVGGKVTRLSEDVTVVTGTPQGSTAEPNAGYAFKGWFATPDCSGTPISTEAVFKPSKENTGLYEPAIYYAKFERNMFTIEFVDDDGDKFESMKMDVQYGATATIPADPTKANARFLGWWYDKDEDGQINGDETNLYKAGGIFTMPECNVTLTAQWEYAKTLTIQVANAEQNEMFFFRVTGPDNVDMVVSAYDGSPATIGGLYKGTYTVTELYNWSWTRGGVSSETAELTATEGAVVTFTMPASSTCWLHGEGHN